MSEHVILLVNTLASSVHTLFLYSGLCWSKSRAAVSENLTVKSFSNSQFQITSNSFCVLPRVAHSASYDHTNLEASFIYYHSIHSLRFIKKSNTLWSPALVPRGTKAVLTSVLNSSRCSTVSEHPCLLHQAHSTPNLTARRSESSTRS